MAAAASRPPGARTGGPYGRRHERVNLASARGPETETSPGFGGYTWYGTEVTTVPLRNSSRPLRNSALWLCSSWPHQELTTNSGITTVTMSLRPLGVQLLHEPQHGPGQLPVRGEDDLERHVDPEVRPVAGDLLVLDLAGVPAARGIVDLGAGSGAGSRLLRERYSDATVICVDNDPQMLERLREQGFPTVEANLDDGFPVLAGPAACGL